MALFPSVFEALTLNVIGNVAFGIDLSDINDETAKRFIMESKRIVYVEEMMTTGTMIWVMFASKYRGRNSVCSFS